jgi:hypothetical protein
VTSNFGAKPCFLRSLRNSRKPTAQADPKRPPANAHQPAWMQSNQGRAWSGSHVLTLPGVMLQGIKAWLNVGRCFMPGFRISIHHFT